jgi:microcompartment protein CcmK/EutM
MGVTAETGVSSGSVVGKMRWYLTAAGTSRQERMTLDTSGTLILYPSGNSGLLGLGDTGAGMYRDNTHDVVVHQSNSSGSPLYLSGAGNVVVSIDNNNNETDRKFIVGSNSVKASNELFSVNESGNGYFSGTLSSGAISITAGGNYPVVATSTQRYFYQARNTNNSVNSSYGWWWFMDTNFNMGFHADGAADRLTLTRDGNLTITGGITTAANTLNLLGSQIYVSPTNSNTLNSGYGVNGSADIWINYRGYNDGQTQYRNFNIGDGRGNNVLWAEGSSSKVVINNSQSAPTDAKLQVNGNIDILDVTNGVFRIYNNTTFRGGLGTDAWAHAGSAANMTLFATGVLHFTSGGTKRAYFDNSGHLLPQVNNTYNLGSASLGWANVYTNDLHLSNMNKPEGNDIDGTSGNWTIQEGAENLYIINNNNGKKFKISLEEII